MLDPNYKYPFYDIQHFPELEILKENWELIRDEGLEYVDSFYSMEDGRNLTDSWRAMPLKPEPDDLIYHKFHNGNALQERIDEWADKFTYTRSLCDSIDNMGYVYSLLGKHGHIAKHIHRLPLVSAILGLDLKDPCVFRVNSDYEYIREGEFMIFDYTRDHESWNHSNKDRLALLISLKNKYIEPKSFTLDNILLSN